MLREGDVVEVRRKGTTPVKVGPCTVRSNTLGRCATPDKLLSAYKGTDGISFDYEDGRRAEPVSLKAVFTGAAELWSLCPPAGIAPPKFAAPGCSEAPFNMAVPHLCTECHGCPRALAMVSSSIEREEFKLQAKRVRALGVQVTRGKARLQDAEAKGKQFLPMLKRGVWGSSYLKDFDALLLKGLTDHFKAFQARSTPLIPLQGLRAFVEKLPEGPPLAYATVRELRTSRGSSGNEGINLTLRIFIHILQMARQRCKGLPTLGKVTALGLIWKGEKPPAWATYPICSNLEGVKLWLLGEEQAKQSESDLLELLQGQGVTVCGADNNQLFAPVKSQRGGSSGHMREGTVRYFAMPAATPPAPDGAGPWREGPPDPGEIVYSFEDYVAASVGSVEGRTSKAEGAARRALMFKGYGPTCSHRSRDQPLDEGARLAARRHYRADSDSGWTMAGERKKWHPNPEGVTPLAAPNVPTAVDKNADGALENFTEMCDMSALGGGKLMILVGDQATLAHWLSAWGSCYEAAWGGNGPAAGLAAKQLGYYERAMLPPGGLHISFAFLDLVYRGHYGGFIQVFQEALGFKRIQKDPVADGRHQASLDLAELIHDGYERLGAAKALAAVGGRL